MESLVRNVRNYFIFVISVSLKLWSNDPVQTVVLFIQHIEFIESLWRDVVDVIKGKVFLFVFRFFFFYAFFYNNYSSSKKFYGIFHILS